MGVQKELLEYLNAYSENRISEKVFHNYLNSTLRTVWRCGLSEESITKCLKFFSVNRKLSRNTRKSLLQCLVPRQKLSKRTVKLLLLWFFSNLKNPDDASLIFHWLSVMISNNMIDAVPIENLFNVFLMCLFVDDLAGPTCDVLKHLVKPGLITPRSVFIVQYYCNLDIKLKDKGKVSFLQRLFYECSPTLFTKPPGKVAAYKIPKDKFSESMIQYAFQNGFMKAFPIQLMQRESTYKRESKSNNVLSSEIPFNPFEDISGMKELGLKMRSKEISLVDINAALGSKEGLIYLSWHHSMEWGFPKVAHCSLEVLDKLLDVCRRVKSGLNFIPALMPSFLLRWDGEEKHEVIYELISWMHFESFEELYKNVLYYIVNLYVTGTVTDKVRIIHSLTKLITNKVTIAPREATVLLISLVCSLIKIGLCGTVLQSSLMLMVSVRFYKYLSFIEERYMLGTWTIAPPFVIFGALFSHCFVLISEICSLVVRYNTVMFNKFTSLGVIGNFEEEEEIAKTYFKDLYLFLWEGQASKTELITSQSNESFYGKLAAQFDSVFSVRDHTSITPLVSFLALQLGRDPRSFTDEDLMKMFSSYCEGLFHLKKTVEESGRNEDF